MSSIGGPAAAAGIVPTAKPNLVRTGAGKTVKNAPVSPTRKVPVATLARRGRAARSAATRLAAKFDRAVGPPGHARRFDYCFRQSSALR